MTVSTELMTVKQRDVIFEDMDEVTKTAATEGAEKLKAGHQVALLISYDLGAIVNRVFEAEHLNEAQQKQEVKKLSAFWNQPTLGLSTLYDLRNVAAAFDRKFIKDQSEERLSSGGYLTWSHFKELQKVRTEKRQLALLKQIRRHSWSANELALELQGKKDAEVKRSGGRKPTLPKTPNAMLQKLFTSVQLADNYVLAVSEPLGGIFMEMPISEVSEQFVENINNALTRIDEAGAHFKETEQKLQAVKERVVSMLNSAAADVAEAATAEGSGDAEGAASPVAGKKRKEKATEKKRGTPRRSGNAAPAEADGILTEA